MVRGLLRPFFDREQNVEVRIVELRDRAFDDRTVALFEGMDEVLVRCQKHQAIATIALGAEWAEPGVELFRVELIFELLSESRPA